MMRSFRERWGGLSPNAKRGIAVGGIVAVLFGFIGAIAHLAPQAPRNNDKQAVVKHILI